MSPVKFLPLTNTKLASAEFYSKLDEYIEINVLKVLDEKNEIIVSSNKVISSKHITSKLYIENMTLELIFSVKEEFGVGLQYTLKLEKSSTLKDAGPTLNCFGGVVLTSSIPSLKIDGREVDQNKLRMNYEAIVLGSDFIIISSKKESQVRNLKDCMKANLPIVLTQNGGDNELFVKDIKTDQLKYSKSVFGYPDKYGCL